MKTVYLISCTKRKKKHTCAAEEMYSPSDLFAASLAYAVERVDNKEEQIHILSTKYGLLRLSERIDSYEKATIGDTESEVKAWSASVVRQIQQLHDISNTNFVFLTGAIYVNSLSSYLPHFETPLRGMPLEPRTTWLQSHRIPQGKSQQMPSDNTIGYMDKKQDYEIGNTLWATDGEPVTVCDVDHNRIRVIREESTSPPEYSCDNCMLMRREECFGEKEICEDYQHVPHVSKEEIDAWPKECMGAYEKK